MGSKEMLGVNKSFSVNQLGGVASEPVAVWGLPTASVYPQTADLFVTNHSVLFSCIPS